jgi:hypothetical protein
MFHGYKLAYVGKTWIETRIEIDSKTRLLRYAKIEVLHRGVPYQIEEAKKFHVDPALLMITLSRYPLILIV